MPSHKLTTGIFLIGGLILFGIGLFLISNRHGLLARNFEVYTEFTHLNGLQNGARVRISGMDAGEVLETRAPERPDSRFRVKLRIQEDLHSLVRTDSVATIKSTGLSENSFIDVEKGTNRAPESPGGSTIVSREPIDLADLDEARQRLNGDALAPVSRNCAAMRIARFSRRAWPQLTRITWSLP